MLVDVKQLDQQSTTDKVIALESSIFGLGAWSPAIVREELFVLPGRTYLADITYSDEQANISAGCSHAGTCPDSGFNASPSQTACNGNGVLRAYGGFWYDGEDAQLMTLGVDGPYRRRGIATALLTALLDRSQGLGAHRMLLEVRMDNASALALYHRFGFQRLGLRKRYYQPENIDAFTMALNFRPRVVGFVSRTATRP